MLFGEALRIAMSGKDMSGKELSEKSKVTPQYISQLVTGTLKDPTFKKARALIAALGMSLQEFSDLQDSDEGSAHD